MSTILGQIIGCVNRARLHLGQGKSGLCQNELAVAEISVHQLALQDEEMILTQIEAVQEDLNRLVKIAG